MLQPIWLWGPWLRRHLLLHLPPLQRPRLLRQVALVVAHPEQVELHLEAPLVEVLEALPGEPGEVLEGQREREVLQAQEGLPAQELLLRARPEQSLEPFLLWGPRLLERELSGWLELRW